MFQGRPIRLTKKAISEAAVRLAEMDPALGKIHRQFGPPPLLRRPATFSFRSIATRMVWQWYVHRRGRDIF